MKLKLNYNQQVDFYEESHSYITKGGKYLQGITGIISKMLFPDKYADIPQYILDKAAEYGTMIHAKCQAQDMFENDPDCIEVENYIKLKQECHLKPLENEYLVSDNERIATMIDNVFSSTKESVLLGDIKTTAVLDLEYLSWQLSICAYLFEMQNPHLRVDKLFGIWLRKEKGEVHEVNRIDNATIESLLDAYFNDKEFTNPLKVSLQENQSLELLYTIENYLITMKECISSAEEDRKKLLESIENEMSKKDIKKWETDKMIFTRVLPTKSKTLDTTKLKKDHSELLEGYYKETERKGYLKLTIR